MGFPNRKWRPFEQVPKFSAINGQWVDDDEATQLVSNAVALGRNTLHNVAGGEGYTPDEVAPDTWDRDFVATPGHNATIYRRPLDQLITGAGDHLWVWALVTRADGASPAYLIATMGRTVKRIDLSAAAGTYELVAIQLPLELVRNPALRNDHEVTLAAGVDWEYGEGNEETFSVRSVSAYEGPSLHRQTYDYPDTTGSNNQLFAEDQPWSVAAERILLRKMEACLRHRLPRRNVIAQCYRKSSGAVATTYTSGYGGFGRWVVPKGAGVQQLEGLYFATSIAFPYFPAFSVRVSLYSIDSIAYTSLLSGFNAGALVTGQTSGARARIQRDEPSHGGGYLDVGWVDGGPFLAGEVIKDDAGGLATVHLSAMTGQRQIAYHEASRSPSATAYWWTWSIGSLIDEASEYELRIDAIEDSAGTVDAVVIPVVFAAEELGTADLPDYPNPAHTEQDDDIRGLDWRKANALLDHVWFKQRQIVLADHRWEYGTIVADDDSQVAGIVNDYASPSEYMLGSSGALMVGLHDEGCFLEAPAWPTPGSRYLNVRAWVRRSTVETTRHLVVSSVSGTFSLNEKVTGASSGATGWVREPLPIATPGTLTVVGIDGEFLPGESLTTAGGDSATIDSVSLLGAADVRLKFATFIDSTDGQELTSVERKLGDIPRNQLVSIQMRLPIAESYWEDFSVDATEHNPYLVGVYTKTDDRGDYLILDRIEVWEEPETPGGWAMSREDMP